MTREGGRADLGTMPEAQWQLFTMTQTKREKKTANMRTHTNEVPKQIKINGQMGFFSSILTVVGYNELHIQFFSDLFLQRLLFKKGKADKKVS